MVLYSVALKEDGTTIYVENAIPHKPYKCLNPNCSSIVYRRGGKRELHFYHPKEGCKHTLKSVIHYETAALIHDVFNFLLKSGYTSFVRTHECSCSSTYNARSLQSNMWLKNDKVIYKYDRAFQRHVIFTQEMAKALAVANSAIKYDLLKGIDN